MTTPTAPGSRGEYVGHGPSVVMTMHRLRAALAEAGYPNVPIRAGRDGRPIVTEAVQIGGLRHVYCPPEVIKRALDVCGVR